MLPIMLTPPADLSVQTLRMVLHAHWGIDADVIDYRPVGFGSHHWSADSRWFLTIDELDLRRASRDDSTAAAFARLTAALGAASALRDNGFDFVVAPEPDRDGAPAVRFSERFALACYPQLAGESFDFGDYRDEAHRRAVLDMLVAMHTDPRPIPARTDDFVIAHRDELELTLADERVPDRGPYATATGELLHANAIALRRAIDRYDALVAAARTAPAAMVLTHGEPHPANTMRTDDGWRLIDWDTALIAPPERDLWDLDPGDGSLFAAYADATGTRPRPDLLELYQCRWDLTDLAEYVHRFRCPHTGSQDDAKSWEELRGLVATLAEGRS